MKKLLLTAFALFLLGGTSVKVSAAISYIYVGDYNGNKNLVDGDRGKKWEGSANSDMWCIFKMSMPGFATSYTLTTGGDNESWKNRNWKDWTVFGGNFANDAAALAAARSTEGGWVVLDSRTNDTTLEDKNTTDYSFTMTSPDTEHSYEYYLIKATATRGDGWMQMGEFAFNDFKADMSAYDGKIAAAKSFNTDNADATLKAEYAALVGTLDALKEAAAGSGNFDNLDTALSYIATLQGYINTYGSSSLLILSYPADAWGDGAAENLFDGNKNTKWGGNFSKGTLIWRLKDGIVPLYYYLTAGGDTGSNTGRNWKSWAIYAANFSEVKNATEGAAEWVEIYSTEDGGMTSESGASKDYDFDITLTENYQYFKLVLKSNVSGGQQQMADLIRLQGAD